MVINKKQFLETNTCTICKGTGEIFTGSEVKKCDCMKSWEKVYKLYVRCLSAGLNKSDIDYDIATYYGDTNIPSAVKGFITKFSTTMYQTNIYFHGRVNTQKSTIARYIARELLRKGYTVKYVLMDELIKTLLKSHDHNVIVKEDALDKTSSYSKSDLLILDESFDNERITLYKSKYQLPFLTTFLKDRLEVVKKSTIFISNKTPKDIESQGFTEALQSLIMRECFNLEFKDSLDKKHAMKSTDFLDLFQ